MLKHLDFPSLEVRGPARPLKNSPMPQSLQVAQCSQAGNILLPSAKHILPHQTRYSTEQVSTAPESSVYTTPFDAWHCT